MNKLILFNIIALCFVSCAKNDDADNDNWNGEITFSSGLMLHSRANNGDVPDRQIAENELVGVHVQGISGEDTNYGYTNVSIKASGNGEFSNYSTIMYYPQSGKNVIISAYHPFNNSALDSYEFVVEQNQNQDNYYFSSDLLWSEKKEYTRGKEEKNLSFVHKLSKITYGLHSGAGQPDVSGATVEILNVETVTRFNRETGNITQEGITSNKKNVRVGEKYGAIIIPQTINKGDKLLKVTLKSGGILYYTVDEPAWGITFESGYVYHYDITVNLTELKVKTSIIDWTPISISGNAYME